MQVKTFWVGDRPGGSWTFEVLNSRTGNPESLAVYNSVRVIMLDTHNDEVDLSDASVAITNATSGLVTFLWPDRDLFEEPGRYVMQLELSSGTAVRRTTVQEILVKEMGGVSK